MRLGRTELMALAFLEKFGPHQVGIIDDEEKLAAALGFDQLKQKGLAFAEIKEGGPEYRITRKGRAALIEQGEEWEFFAASTSIK